jgi:hypothetical protein
MLEASLSVLDHRLADVFAVIARLIFVEQPDDLPHHDLRWIVAEFLVMDTRRSPTFASLQTHISMSSNRNDE